MIKKTTRGRKPGRIVLAVYKDTDALDFVGIFLNSRHIEDAFGIHNANVGKYLDLKLNELHGLIVVEIDAGKEAIDIEKLREIGKNEALVRRTKSKLLKLNNETILGLSHEQINKINDIVNGK